MTKTIVQKVLFKNTTPKALFELYTNAKKHSAATGGNAKISAKNGSAFTAHGGYISGKNLHIEANKLIVQSWRAQDWDKNEADSTFIINLEKKGKDVVLHAVHSTIPEKHAAGVDKGWHDYYWKPWKQFLAGKPVKKAQEM